MSPSTSRPRLPRFARSTTPPALQLTERDLQILDAVHAYRLLTRDQIQRLLFAPTGTTACKRRLMLLYQVGFLGRIALPIRNAYGAARAVYYVEPRAIRLLVDEARTEYPSRLRHDTQREELFLRHTLAINDVRIGMTMAAAAARHDVLWWDEQELRRRGIRARLQDQQSDLRVLPDAYFVIAAGGVPDGFALELDRGTVTERRMRARFRAYGEWVAAGAFRHQLPCGSLRVLIVVDPERDRGRVLRLKRWCEEERGGSLFWFTDLATIASAADLGSPIWFIAGESERRALTLSGAI